MKKTLALLLAAVMLLACIPASLAEAKEISVMIQYRDIDDLDFANMPYFNDPDNGITVQSGVHATFNQIKGSDWSTKVNLMLASGETRPA